MTAARDDRSDAELVDAINAGPPHAEPAFAALYHRHRDFVVRAALRFTADEHRALDIAHDTFIALLDRFPGFELRSQLTTYLYAIVRNRAATEARRSRPTSELFETSIPSPPGVDLDEEGLGALRAAVARLPETHREVLILRVVEDLSVSDVAMALGIPTGTVKSRLHDALATLRTVPALRKWFEA